jgi:hypothetical protein
MIHTIALWGCNYVAPVLVGVLMAVIPIALAHVAFRQR